MNLSFVMGKLAPRIVFDFRFSKSKYIQMKTTGKIIPEKMKKNKIMC